MNTTDSTVRTAPLKSVPPASTDTLTSPARPASLTARLKTYLLQNPDTTFVIITMLSLVVINWIIPDKVKVTFLNFYYLPIIWGGYYLGRRNAVFGAVAVLAATVFMVSVNPEAFLTDPTEIGLYIQILTWGGFLILAGAVVGGLHEKLVVEVETTRRLNQQLQGEHEELNRAHAALQVNTDNLEYLNRELQHHQEELNRANTTLKDYSDNLEHRVKERTEELKQANASLKDYADNLENKVNERT